MEREGCGGTIIVTIDALILKIKRITTERLNNIIRACSHKRRGYKSLNTGRWQMRNFEVYYNHIRSHMVIKQTPAEKGLIEYYGCKTEKNRWQHLIEQAAKSVYFYLSH
jgi:hypothetical protein